MSLNSIIVGSSIAALFAFLLMAFIAGGTKEK